MTQPAAVSAYVPCYNNAGTIALTLAGMRAQTHPIDDLFVVDDGSTDNSAEIVEKLGVRLVRMEKNLGRGAVRARAMEEARHEFVLCCDGTNRLVPTFLADALKWMERDYIIGVLGRWFDPNPRSIIDRWRARHLFQQQMIHKHEFNADLSTHGTLMRKSAVMKAGNFNPALRHGEDYDLGQRLLGLGDIVYDPDLRVETVVHNTLVKVMERYTRWNRSGIETYSMTNFLESHLVAWRIMMPRDFAAGDWPSACISALLPYFALANADKVSFTFTPRVKVQKAAPIHESGKNP